MNSDERKSDDYWMGVRDALRMIDSFHRWSRQNPKRAKKLEDFIADGLIAAAKRCKSCLSRELGIKFKEDEHEREDLSDIAESFKPTGVPAFFEESSDSTEPFISPEIPPDFEAPVSSDSVTDEELIEPTVSIESDAPHSAESPRDFSTDFELVEPEPLITKPEASEPEIRDESEITGPPEFDIEEELPDISGSDSLEDTIESQMKTPPSIDEEPPSDEPETTTSRFSWDDHEDEPSTSIVSPELDFEIPEPKESSAKVRIWSPYDEPSISETDASSEPDSSSKEPEDAEEESELDSSPSTTEEPPAPPPPPESDESEEERKRRARRLFFGS